MVQNLFRRQPWTSFKPTCLILVVVFVAGNELDGVVQFFATNFFYLLWDDFCRFDFLHDQGVVGA